MSYKRKQAQRIAALHEWYEAPSGNEEALGGDIDSIGYSPSYPGARETRLLDADNVVMPDYAIDKITDMVKWDAEGIPGQTKIVGSMGVTDPQTVETHTWDRPGEMAVIRRMPDTNYGPVKTSDHNSLLSLLYAMQETAAYYPNDISQIDVIKAV